MSAVTAKVKCTAHTVNGDTVALAFGPDYADDRNADWAAATPHLSLSMTVKANVGEHFKLNDAYTLTFEPSAE